jgi:hypothetical protein
MAAAYSSRASGLKSSPLSAAAAAARAFASRAAFSLPVFGADAAPEARRFSRSLLKRTASGGREK